MSDYSQAIQRLRIGGTKSKLRIGADTMPTTGTTMDVARARLLGIAALNTFLGVQNHKRWLLWGVKKDGSYVSYASDDERDMNDAFGYVGMEGAPADNTKYGDLSGMVYGAYWDTSNPKAVAKDEYLGELTVTATPPAPTPAAPTPKKSGGMGWILALLGIGGGGYLLMKKGK